MAMYSNGLDFDEYRTDNFNYATNAYYDMIKKYPQDKKEEKKPKPLTGKYAKLRDDLRKAMKAGEEVNFGEDGGTCNHDAPSLTLPRWNSEKIKQAAEEAGTRVWVWSFYGNRRFVVGLPHTGQANRRCRVSKAMCKSLESSGYDVLEYSSMD